MKKFIKIKGAKEHNLKSFDLTLPLYKFICITGVSGAGKSSLAFDILYSEGQRRYVETFSAYVRQFLERLPKANAKEISCIPPAISIEQKNPVKSSRSTVGTLTELTHFMKMLFYRASTAWCPNCNIEILKKTPIEAANYLISRFSEEPTIITCQIKTKSDPEMLKKGLIIAGYFRAYINDKIYDITELNNIPNELDIVLDRLKIGSKTYQRLIEAIEQGFSISGATTFHLIKNKEKITFNNQEICPICGFSPPKKNLNLFSFNSPVGACPSCRGFGRIIDIDWDLVIPDKNKSISQGAISILEMPSLKDVREDLFSYLTKNKVDLDCPWIKLPETIRNNIIYGDQDWYGIKGFFNWLESKSYKTHVRIFLSRYRAYIKCPLCNGTRFSKETLCFKLAGLSLPEFYTLEIKDAFKFIKQLESSLVDKANLTIITEIENRLSYLIDVGLEYLSLDRQSRTLSGGEVARVMLTRALASQLVETLYVIDEPSKGLHPIDTNKIIGFLKSLSQQGNTVVVVEHDPDIILSSDHIIDLGPGAGELGGRLLYEGEPSKFIYANTPTSNALRQTRKDIGINNNLKDISSKDFLIIKGARENNLKDIDVRFPIGKQSVITGISGSGKSTLLELILYRGLKRLKGQPIDPPGEFDNIIGHEFIDNIILIDQSPIGKSPRANPATYLKLYGYIRKLFSKTKKAKELGLTESCFSFNSTIGQCSHCKGLGFEHVEMQFLSDIYIPCPICKGKRFKPEILNIKYKGLNIYEFLNLTFNELKILLKEDEKILPYINAAIEVGLGYLRLGQPLNTLSSGEAQRLKIAKQLSIKEKQNNLFLLDEPSIGLHLKDIEYLIKTLRKLINSGNTVIIIEHHQEIILSSDWIIDLGPKGGKRGGELIYCGSINEFLNCKTSYTAKALKRYLKKDNYIKDSITQAIAKQDITSLKDNFENLKDNKHITIVGARHHNLKNIDIRIPREQLTIITGISGSGKSTLAFDIVFAEGQRRYIECLPAYVRQFIKLYEKPDIDAISGIPPTVAIAQKTSIASNRSTVGTLTEVLHYLRLLYAKLSTPYCPKCGKILNISNIEDILKYITEEFKSKTISIFAPKIRRRKGSYKQLFLTLKKAGYKRVRVDKTIFSLDQPPQLSRYKEHNIEVLISTIDLNNTDLRQLKNVINKALEEGDGEAIIITDKKERLISQKIYCNNCNIYLPEPDPLLFSFNTKAGACSNCNGIGVVDDEICPICKGTRLKKEALYFKINGLNLAELCNLTAKEVLLFVENLRFSDERKKIAEPIIKEVHSKLKFLCEVGLSYLPLSRSADTLSGGEAQRVRLAAQLGSNLTGVCYILDEPTIGLHPRDNKRLIKALLTLKERGNTVIVVEHDEEMLKNANFIIDLGPGGGSKGGEITFAGDIKDLIKNPNSITAKVLNDKNRYKITSKKRIPKRFISIKGVQLRNLKNINVNIPLGCLCIVTGVSGSGKSTLVMEALYKNLKNKLISSESNLIGIKEIAGYNQIKRVKVVDHQPIGRTPRSCPGTYIGIIDDIRKLFASLPKARELGWGPGRFSFNVTQGRCDQCKGQGEIKVEMKFLPEVYIKCEKCMGKRFNEETLKIKYKGKDISEVLSMTIEEAREFFSSVPKIHNSLSILCDLGLNYLTLGQPSPTLSGGEAQRIKLASEFVKAYKGTTLYILDEPSTGLHIADIKKLMSLIQKLVDRGDTVVLIEHNLEVIKEADWIIDLGPEGGDNGGEVMFQGTLKELIKTNTHTSQALKEFLDEGG